MNDKSVLGCVWEGSVTWPSMPDHESPLAGRIVAAGADFLVVREFFGAPLFVSGAATIRPFEPAKDKDARRPITSDPRFLAAHIGDTFTKFDAAGRKIEGTIEAQGEDFFVVRKTTGEPLLVDRTVLAGSTLVPAASPDKAAEAHRAGLLAAMDEREREIEAQSPAHKDVADEEIEAMYESLLADAPAPKPAPEVVDMPDEGELVE